MKAKWIMTVLALMMGGTAFSATPTDSTGMPGDNLDLYAVMDLFKKSDNLEDFEKALNDPNNKVNNLDLNHDGQIDYIRVVDNSDNGAHAIVLQVPINDKESQDVAVIEVEKDGLENAKIQIVGDEDVYGDNYVVEPYSNYVTKDQWDAEHNNNTTVADNSNTTVVVNVWAWPCVTYIYGPYYRPWHSPWYWGYYPGWWRPWRPYPWHAYYGFVGYYHGGGYYYHRAHVYRASSANQVYYGHRTSSETYRRSAPVVKNTNAHVAHNRSENTVTPGNNHRTEMNPVNNNHPREKVNPARQKTNPVQHTQGNMNPASNQHPKNEGRPRTNPAPRQRAGGNQPRMHGGGGHMRGGGGGGHRH